MTNNEIEKQYKYFQPTTTTDWWERSMGKTEGRKRRGWQRMKWLNDITDNGYDFEQNPGDSEGQRSL